MTAEELARECAHLAADKKAADVVVLDMRGVSTFTDFFVICSGNSEPHLKAIGGEIQEKLRTERGVRPLKVDGYPVSQWVVMDFGGVIVHLFYQEKRSYYALEDLWSDAPRLAWETAALSGPSAASRQA